MAIVWLVIILGHFLNSKLVDKTETEIQVMVNLETFVNNDRFATKTRAINFYHKLSVFIYVIVNSRLMKRRV